MDSNVGAFEKRSSLIYFSNSFPENCKNLFARPEEYSKTCQTSKMDRFAAIDNG